MFTVGGVPIQELSLDGLDISFQQMLRENEKAKCSYEKEEPTDPQSHSEYQPHLSIYPCDSTYYVSGTMLGSWKNSSDQVIVPSLKEFNI